MDVTPKLLEDVEFREKFRGYDPEEVDDFLERVAIAFAQIQEKARDLNEQIESANSRAARAEARARDSSDNDDTLRRTLVLAQRTADAAIKEAEENAAAIVAAAEAQARQHYAAAEDRASQSALQADQAAQQKAAEADEAVAERLRGADSQSEATLANAREQASRLLVDARQKADRLIAEAESTAIRQAEEKLARLTQDVAGMERRRDALAHDVNALDAHGVLHRERLAAVLAQLETIVNEPSGLGSVELPELGSASFDDAVAGHIARVNQHPVGAVAQPDEGAPGGTGDRPNPDVGNRLQADPGTGSAPAGPDSTEQPGQATPADRTTGTERTAGEDPGRDDPSNTGAPTAGAAPVSSIFDTGERAPAAPGGSLADASTSAPSGPAPSGPTASPWGAGRVSRDPVGRDEPAASVPSLGATPQVAASSNDGSEQVGTTTPELAPIDLDAPLVGLAGGSTTPRTSAPTTTDAGPAVGSGPAGHAATDAGTSPAAEADRDPSTVGRASNAAAGPASEARSGTTAGSTIPPMARPAADRPSIGLGLGREGANQPQPSSAAPPWMGMAPPPPPPPPPSAEQSAGSATQAEPGAVPPPPPAPAVATGDTTKAAGDTFLEELRRAVGEEPEDDEAVRFFEDRDPTDPALRFFEGTDDNRSRFRRR